MLASTVQFSSYGRQPALRDRRLLAQGEWFVRKPVRATPIREIGAEVGGYDCPLPQDPTACQVTITGWFEWFLSRRTY